MGLNTCKNYETCPIFTGRLLDKEITAKSYKAQYCNAGPAGWNNCKRYQVKEKTGKCPPDLLPNSMKSIEEIIQNMDQ
ncbi:MAG: hypothetical protein JXB49_23420 [Bacteroidales bacterium]|nr:hypothetical protein [Bacteroidales bacterium]